MLAIITFKRLPFDKMVGIWIVETLWQWHRVATLLSYILYMYLSHISCSSIIHHRLNSWPTIQCQMLCSELDSGKPFVHGQNDLNDTDDILKFIHMEEHISIVTRMSSLFLVVTWRRESNEPINDPCVLMTTYIHMIHWFRVTSTRYGHSDWKWHHHHHHHHHHHQQQQQQQQQTNPLMGFVPQLNIRLTQRFFFIWIHHR